MNIEVNNVREPIRLKGVQINGIAAASTRAGEPARIWTRLALTSDDVGFHRIAENLASIIQDLAYRAASPVALDRAATILLVIKPDDTAELWIDAAAVGLRCMVKRSLKAGSVVRDSDIADVTGMFF